MFLTTANPSRNQKPIRNLAILFALTITWQLPSELMGQSSEKNGQQPIVRVFVLAGQSNMQGQGVVDLDHPEHYNGGKGTLLDVIKHSSDRYLMQHLRGDNGQWRQRDDVFVWNETEKELKVGRLGIGFTGYPGQHHFGPELQIGHVLGDAFDEPVLLIKTAWGGKSLGIDFRPPSSGGEVGPYYRKMLEQLATAMEQAPGKIPALRDHTLKIQGFIWQQGWNDMVSEWATEQYAENLKNLIADTRKQFGVANLPFVYGELGNTGDRASDQLKKFRQAQASVGKMELPAVAYVPTAAFARPADQSPNPSHEHHWSGNAESYFLVGDALGRAMLELMIPAKDRTRVLILGDSISIGYTPYVQRLLESRATVIRPTRNGRPENCQGTDNGIANIDRWLELEGGDWDVIHFNFGLHDMKHVDTKTGKNSNSPDDPLQSPPEEYRKQLREIVTKLQATGAQLVMCTTTPVPEGVKPLRETTSPQVYNQIAREVCAELSTEDRTILVNDLYQFANGRLESIQQPANVHFSPLGSKTLATEVARQLEKAIGMAKHSKQASTPLE